MDHPMNNFLKGTIVPRVNEDYITQVFEIERTVAKKLSQEFSMTESQIRSTL